MALFELELIPVEDVSPWGEGVLPEPVQGCNVCCRDVQWSSEQVHGCTVNDRVDDLMGCCKTSRVRCH